MNIALSLERAGTECREKTAIRFASRSLSYAELAERTRRTSSLLRESGVGQGDRVAILLHNSHVYIEVLFAVFRLGAVAVPLNVRLHAREVAQILSDSGARLLVTEPALALAVESTHAPPGVNVLLVTLPGEAADHGLGYPELEAQLGAASDDVDVQEVAEDEPAWLFYTSGTTGRSKGAVLTHRNLREMTMSMLADLCSLEPCDVVFHAAPLSHGAGLYVLPAIAKACTNVIYSGPGFKPADVWQQIRANDVSVISFLVPTQIKRLVEEGQPAAGLPPSLRAIIWGGAPLYCEDARLAREVLGDILVGLYGQGEAPMTITGLTPRDLAEELGGRGSILSVGRARTNVEVRVVNDKGEPAAVAEIGEIVVRGGVVMKGYWNDPRSTEETLRNGWLHTGDLGYVDNRGRFFLVDRKKDLIISGGSNIYPREVEEALLEHPAVREVLVFGIPDSEWGEAVAAAIVPVDSALPPSEAELIEFCTGRIARYKRPRRIFFVDDLPKSAYGKLLRREAKARLLGR